MTIGRRIKERRKELKMSVDELAKKLGKDRSTVYRYENGDIENLPIDIIKPIAQALDVEPQFLMDWKDASPEEIEISNINADITDRLLKDKVFGEVVGKLNELTEEQLNRANILIDLLFKESFDENK